jgi:predicted transcriptional regulator
MLGLLGKRALEVDPTTTVEQVMDPGPSTFRPNVSLEEMADYLREHELTRAWVTTSDGKLVGLLERDLLEQSLLSGQRRSG